MSPRGFQMKILKNTSWEMNDYISGKNVIIELSSREQNEVVSHVFSPMLDISGFEPIGNESSEKMGRQNSEWATCSKSKWKHMQTDLSSTRKNMYQGKSFFLTCASWAILSPQRERYIECWKDMSQSLMPKKTQNCFWYHYNQW